MQWEKVIEYLRGVARDEVARARASEGSSTEVRALKTAATAVLIADALTAGLPNSPPAS